MLIVVLLAGCGGGGDDEPSRSREETARAWIDAANAEDYERACELSVVADQVGCVELMELKPFG